jgi:hypothetical protein
MQTEPRKLDLPRILVEGNAPTQRRPLVPSMDAEAGRCSPLQSKCQLQNFMEMGDAGFAGDQEASPNQGTKLIKACHLRSLPDLARKLHNLPLESSALQSGDIAMLGLRGAGITKYAGPRGVTQRREPHGVAVLAKGCCETPYQ